MNIILWILQIMLALHTATGGIWKFSNSEQTVPSLASIPHSLWLILAVLELICCLCLLAPLIFKSTAKFASKAAAFVVAEMIVFSLIHLFSKETNNSPVFYWIVVAAFAGFIAYKRTERKTYKSAT